MDYHDGSAGNAHLAVIKYAATAKKLGSIFFNPGDCFPYPPWPLFNAALSQVDPRFQESRSLNQMGRDLAKYSRVHTK